MSGQHSGGSELNRRSVRSRKISKNIGIVSNTERKQATAARLDALENDDHVGDALGEDSDDEFILEESEEDEGPIDGKRKKKQKKGGKVRKTRGMLAEQKGPRSFATLLEEAELDKLPPGVPSYLTAAEGPPVGTAPRKWCSVCGFAAPYTCTRCGSRFCNKKCYAVHMDTRCLKFVG